MLLDVRGAGRPEEIGQKGSTAQLSGGSTPASANFSISTSPPNANPAASFPRPERRRRSYNPGARRDAPVHGECEAGGRFSARPLCLHGRIMHVVSKTVKPLLDDLLGFPCTQIGFLTLDITLHFHNFNDNLNVESAPGPALKAAFMVMGQIGEGLLVFQSTLPSLGIVCLKLQGDDIRAYGTDKKHIPREPEGPFYKQMSSEFTKNQIAVDIFSFE